MFCTIRFSNWALALLLTTLGGLTANVAQAQSAPDEPDFIVPSRPTVSNPAEFQKPGVLQLEVGYNANFREPGIHLQQDMPLALRFAVNRRLLLEFDGDSPSSQTVAGLRTTGAGDSQLARHRTGLPGGAGSCRTRHRRVRLRG